MADPWYRFENEQDIPSPALLVYPDRVEENLRRIVRLAGGTERLRPHVKTHKMSQVVRLKRGAGITKFKCATIAEAEMVAAEGPSDIFLAFPQVGPNVERLVNLVAAFPQSRFSTVVDDPFLIRHLSAAFTRAGSTIDVLIDIDNGMHRTGIAPGPAAFDLYRLLVELPGVAPGGLHVYDGQHRDADLAARRAGSDRDFEAVDALIAQLRASGWPVPRIVAGGTPSFPVHATHTDREVSPGTCIFWDVSYRTKFPDLEFVNAALLLGRVISKPGGNRICIDWGYKSVSPDNSWPRLECFSLPDATLVNHSEEHLTLECPAAANHSVGDVVFAIPFHVCPTVALHREAVIVRGGRAVETWPVVARDRRLSV